MKVRVENLMVIVGLLVAIGVLYMVIPIYQYGHQGHLTLATMPSTDGALLKCVHFSSPVEVVVTSDHLFAFTNEQRLIEVQDEDGRAVARTMLAAGDWCLRFGSEVQIAYTSVNESPVAVVTVIYLVHFLAILLTMGILGLVIFVILMVPLVFFGLIE